VQTAQTAGQTTIMVVGRAADITTGFASAIEAEGWRWEEAPDVLAPAAAPLPPRTLIALPIPAFTATTCGTIRHLAVTLALPVVVFGGECRAEIVDAVLQAGADDFVPLPVTIEEMIARLAAVIRVRLGAQGARFRSDFLLDEAARTVSIAHGVPIPLTVSEYRLLRLLLATPNRPVARGRLGTIPLPHDETDGEDALDAAMRRLRHKVGADRIVTVRGIGYELVDHRQPPDNLTYIHEASAARTTASVDEQ
jgi:DNA-binding response OmpR family regulator